MKILLDSEDNNRSLLKAFLEDPQGHVLAGEVYKPGSRGYAVKVLLAGQDVFVKEYRCLGTSYRILNAFRRSRAVYSWSVSWKLLAAGVIVPRPLFCVENRTCRLLDEAYLATEFVSGGVDLLSYWKKASEETRSRTLGKCAEVLGKMHALGWRHGDLKWKNILIRETTAAPDIILVDIDAARHCSFQKKRRITSDVSRFIKDLKKQGVNEQEVASFLLKWKSYADC